MLSIKRLYQWLPWISAVGMSLVFLAFMRHDLQIHQLIWKERLEWTVQRQQTALERGGQELARDALILTQQLLLDHSLTDALQQAYRHYADPRFNPQLNPQADAAQLAASRRALYLQLEQPWRDMAKAGANQLTLYFVPGATAFLRMHHPDRFGDSLEGVRPLLADAFHSATPILGADVSRLGSGYRSLVPITAGAGSTQVIAVLEVVMASLPVRATGAPGAIGDNGELAVEMAMFLRKVAVEQMLWQDARQTINENNPTVVDDWRLEETSHPQVNAWWNRGLIAVGQQGQLLQDQAKTYLVSWWPVLQAGSASDQSDLAMAVWSDITPAFHYYQATRHKAIAKWLAALTCALALLLLFVRFNRRYIRQMMARHSEQMSAEHAQSEQARQRLALALRSSDSGFWEWDIVLDTGNFSPEWRQWCGIGPASPDSLDLDEWMSRIHPADKRLSYTDIVRHIKGETAMYENEYRLKARDGSYKWILTRGKVVEWLPDGRAALMVGVYTDITARKTTELVSIRQQAALHALSEISSLPALEPAEQLRLALELGARYLGLGHGMIGEVNGDDYRVGIEFSQNNKPVPVANHLAKTYCSFPVALGDVFAEDDIPSSEHRQHPAYLLTQVESYIGAPLWIGDKLYGAVSFFSRRTRHHQYDALDKDFMRLLARWVGSVVERWQQEQEKKIILNRFQKLSGRLPGFLYQFQLQPDGRAFFPYASSGIKTIYNLTPEDALVSAEKLEDGSVLWHGYVSDITQLKEAELRLQETNALHKAILDAASVSIISVDNSGIIRTFNRGAELMLGYSAAEVIAKQTLLFAHLPEEIAEHARRLTEELGYEVKPGLAVFMARVREGVSDEREWIFVRKDGMSFPALLTVSVLQNDAGEVTGYLGVARDISEIKRIDRMKTEFISTVSHELRTPLTAISGALGIVAHGLGGKLPEDAARMIHIAHNNAQRLIRLVNDLLDMEKLVAGKMDFDLQPQKLLPLIQQSMESNAAFAAQYGVTYQLAAHVSAAAMNAEVVVDAERLLQVMANYLSNAAKFSPQNDQVIVDINVQPRSLRVKVVDHGPGVPEEFRAQLFQKFSQADASDTRQKGGTGLGLAISKEIIERMGGGAGVESIPGQGASFYFDLPLRGTTLTEVPSAAVNL